MTLINSNKDFDFIVVGGGTAGCVVAGRLAENPSVKILVIEAGVSNPKDNEAITTPARAFELRGSKWDWGYKTTMIDRPEYTRIEKPNTRGKVLGGSSCLNYYTWIRGSAATFDDWAAFGGSEWTWAGCKEYFDKPATFHDDQGLFPKHLQHIGTSGPVHVSPAELVAEAAPFREALKTAWVSKGEKLNDEIYDGEMHGLATAVSSIYKGTRSSSWLFLEGKKNVTVLGQTNSRRLIIENNRAVGVEVIGPDGGNLSFRANYEVIVASGVYESPKLLMLSGIGPKEHLRSFGIETIVDSPHVGQNLLDHPIMPHVFKLKDGYGLDQHLLRAGPEKDGAVSSYRWKHKGPLGSGLLELIGLPRIDERLRNCQEYTEYLENNGGVDPFGPSGQPHFEIDFVPMFCDAFQWHIPTPPQGDYFTVIVDLLRPLSQNGTVTLNSTNPLEQAKININFFSSDLDLIAMREGVRFVDDIIMNGEGMKDIIESDYPWPMPRNSDEAMIKMILERSQTGFHPCGTTRMSQNIEQGVVDNKLRVHGVDSLRVVDASVIPVIPDCRIQNAVYMIAEKTSDMIKAAYPELYQ
ncbi:putative GMC-type oxidoreductase [Colletotrichum spaethianum]|uniref:GMC-type oxidoreductase n=1 Tax=Colletotrichum spaethianum TaxID=700344 RepID=A0AA37LB15_9PEZI|nr:putative GMC-type oxidoreductase [Colletotrichum spaethianum]GKT45167.1 putative GMC-type oxidoreductase [Colletotrichum spaethianum]